MFGSNPPNVHRMVGTLTVEEVMELAAIAQRAALDGKSTACMSDLIENDDDEDDDD